MLIMIAWSARWLLSSRLSWIIGVWSKVGAPSALSILEVCIPYYSRIKLLLRYITLNMNDVIKLFRYHPLLISEQEEHQV